MKKNRIVIIALSFFAFFLFWSCEGYFDQFNMDKLSTEVELNPSLALPVAKGSFSIQDIFEVLADTSGLVSLTEDSLIVISYANAAFSLDAENLLIIPDQTGTETYFKSDIEIPDWFIFPEGTVFNYGKTEKIEFGLDPEDKIDSLILKSGSMIFDVFSDFRHDGYLIMTSNNLVNTSGETFYDSLTISQIGGNYSNTITRDISGYRLILDQSNDSAFVNFSINLSLEKSSAGISESESAGINVTFRDVKYRSLFGRIAERAVTDLEQSIDLDFFSTIDNLPEIYFADPQINLYIDNSFGLPLTLVVNKFQGRSSVDGSLLDLSIDDLFNPFTVAAPTVAQIGQSVRSVLSYNVATSNIDEFIASVPDRIDFSFNASTGNPEGSTEQNFLLDTSKVDLEAEVLIPMWFSTTGYTLKDTLDIDLEGLISQLDLIERVNFRLQTTNEWPLELALQLYFLDESDVVIDSLFDEKTGIIVASPVTADGEIDRLALTENVLDIEFEEADFENLGNTKKMMLVATVNTSNEGQTAVKFYTSYLLDYKFSISGDFRINPSDFNFN